MSILIIPPRNKIEDALRQGSRQPVYENRNTRGPNNARRYILIALSFLIIVPTFIYGIVLIYRHVSQPTTIDNNTLIADVGKDVQLPVGETPTIATITDLAPLAGQAFFKDAHVGDKVLIFSTSKEAVLYRPSTKKVIVVAPINSK